MTLERPGTSSGGRPPRILFLIASHKNPVQVRRLTAALLATGSAAQVIIHHDGNAERIDPSWFTNQPVYLMPRPVRVRWGDYSQVELVLRCLKWATQARLAFDWLILLSGQDYPIEPTVRIERLLGATRFDGFLEIFDDVKNPWWPREKIRRYCYRYVTFPGSAAPLLRPLAHRLNDRQTIVHIKVGQIGCKVGVRRSKVPFSGSLRCFGGRQWFTLSGSCIRYLCDVVTRNPQLVAHYKRTAHPDESFFHTILLNNSRLNICPDNQRFMRWSAGSANPDVLVSRDFDEIVASGKLFARKFDASVDSRILDRLDQKLGSAG